MRSWEAGIVEFRQRWVAAVGSAALVSGLLVVTAPASYAAVWGPKPTWSQFNSRPGEGIFQQDLRMFGDNGKETDDAAQHGTVYIRTDVRSVTLEYDCKRKQGSGQFPASSCAGQQMQFTVDRSGFDLSRVTLTLNGVTQTSGSSQYTTVTADDSGVATLVIGVTDKGKRDDGLALLPDDFLAVSLSNCDRTVSGNSCEADAASGTGATDTIGPMNLLWEDAGYYPQVKIVNQDLSPALPNCGGVRWARDETWDWSVFKRSWFGEYACVYVKSYEVGQTARVPYRVLDIWGTPMVNYPVDFKHPGTPPNCGTVACKWAEEESHKYTDSQGYVVFTALNRNTAAEACKNVGYNQDTKETHTCALGVGMEATTGMQPESRDLFWPQFVNTMEMPDNYIEFHVMKRGPRITPRDELGAVTSDDVYDASIPEVALRKNPPLAVDTNGEAAGGPDFQDALIRATLDVKYLFNSNPDTTCFKVLDPKKPQRVQRFPNCKEKVALYAPEVVVSADNGGRVLKVCPDTNDPAVCRAAQLLRTDDIVDVSQMKTSESFGWQYLTQLLFTATRPGKTTFTLTIGKRTYTVGQTYLTDPSYVRSVAASEAVVNADLQQTKSVRFQVVDRFGNGYSGIPVTVTQSGGSFAAGGESLSLVSDETGYVSVDVTETGNATQTVTAAIAPQVGTQIGNAGDDARGVPASVTVATTTVIWGAVRNSSAPKVTGVAKVGAKLTATSGQWIGRTPVTYSYVWYACTARSAAAVKAPRGCSVIKGAIAASFKPTKSQRGKFIGVLVRAKNIATPAGVAHFSGTTAKKVL